MSASKIDLSINSESVLVGAKSCEMIYKWLLMALGFGEGVIDVLFNYIAVIVIQLCEYENWMYPLRNNKVKKEIIKLYYMYI